MSDEKFNGWTNYETWRVHLEMFDGVPPEDLFANDDLSTRYKRGQALKEYAEDFICAASEEGLVQDWALAFIQNVDWYAIADHVWLDDDATKPPQTGLGGLT
jgi:hypothetical protein